MKMSTHLGRGMKFPPQVDPVTGRFVTSENAQSVKESIYLILMTQKGERLMRPEFGSRTAGYVFSDTGLTMLHIMAYELERDITRNEPRVQEVEIQMDNNTRPGCLLVHICYQVKGSSTPENLDFPFYRGDGTGEGGAGYETAEDDLLR